MNLWDIICPPPLTDLPDYDPDWQAGDRAMCIHQGGWCIVDSDIRHPGPDYRQIVRVTAVRQIRGYVFLDLDAFPGNHYAAGFFRKIRPASDAEWIRKARAKPRDLVPA